MQDDTLKVQSGAPVDGSNMLLTPELMELESFNSLYTGGNGFPDSSPGLFSSKFTRAHVGSDSMPWTSPPLIWDSMPGQGW